MITQCNRIINRYAISLTVMLKRAAYRINNTINIPAGVSKIINYKPLFAKNELPR